MQHSTRAGAGVPRPPYGRIAKGAAAGREVPLICCTQVRAVESEGKQIQLQKSQVEICTRDNATSSFFGKKLIKQRIACAANQGRVFLYSGMASEAPPTPVKDWSPASWRKFPIKQQPQWPSETDLHSALQQGARCKISREQAVGSLSSFCLAVSELPPIVTANEVRNVRKQLAEVAQGKRFLLQGGDCAERFADCASQPIEQKLKIMLQMSLVLTWGARIPTLRVGRIAGQFAKPRSSPTEVVDGGTLTCSSANFRAYCTPPSRFYS